MSVVTTIAAPRVDFDHAVDALRDLGPEDEDFDGWYCVRTAPFPCPAPGCDFVAVFMTAAHLVVVWPRKDDPLILAAAANAKLLGRLPQIVRYDRSFGPCISQDLWNQIGRPVHGKLPRSDDWDSKAPNRL